jgi:hypothetical protein
MALVEPQLALRVEPSIVDGVVVALGQQINLAVRPTAWTTTRARHRGKTAK